MIKKKIIISFFILFLGFAYIYFFSSFVFPWQKNNVIQTTLNWGGLAEFPEKIENLSIEKDGNLFSRTFLIEFNANQIEIQNWIIKSKRLKNNIPEVHDEIKTYKIYPGENGSFGGKVSIDKGKVIICMSWS